MSETSQKIEALIFASSKPISENDIKKRLDIHEDISEVMSNLESAYQHRGINLKKISKGGYFYQILKLVKYFMKKKKFKKDFPSKLLKL